MEDTNFVTGMWFSKPNDGAPDFIKGKISIKAESFLEWIKGKVNEKGYVNIVLKKSKAGKLYLQYDNWSPKPQNGEVKPEELPDDF